MWAAFDASLRLPDGTRKSNLVWKQHVPFFDPKPAEQAQADAAVANELRMLQGPLAHLQGRIVPRLYGTWVSPSRDAHAMLMGDAGRPLTASEAENPVVR